MPPLVSPEEPEVSTFSDLLRVLEEQQEVHHLRRLRDLVPEFHDCVPQGFKTAITLEFAEVLRLGTVMVSMGEVVRVVLIRIRRVLRMSLLLLMEMVDL